VLIPVTLPALSSFRAVFGFLPLLPRFSLSHPNIATAIAI
jgi:hypothetical protein